MPRGIGMGRIEGEAMPHKFNITSGADNQFKFDFSYNSEKIFWSENYKRKASAKSGIESLKKNGPDALIVDLSEGEAGSGYRFEIVKSKDGRHFVRFVASNGETMARTETYASKASAKNAVEALKKNGVSAEVLDLSLPNLPEEPLPEQEIGTRFEIIDGVLAIAERQNLGEVGDLRRLHTLLPLLREAIQQIVEATPAPANGANSSEEKLRRHALLYASELDREISSINFGLLFGLGSMLQNRLYADVNMSAESDLTPLSDRQRGALRDFQDIHGPFLTASSEGLQALAAAERVERNPAEERQLAAAIATVADIFSEGDNVVSPQAVDVLADAANEMGKGKQADRLTAYGVNTARNFAIVAIAGTLSAAIVGGASVAFGPIGFVASSPIALAILEATKKSAAFRDLTKPITEAMDQAQAANYARLGKKSIPALRKLAGGRPEMQWLRDYLDTLDEMLK
jgi:uncharacterized protein YegP (UPF0339 family)